MNVRASQQFTWLIERTGVELTPKARAIVAYDGAGRTLGMVAYDHWTPNSVQMHVAIDSAMAARALRRPAFQYPFWQCGKGLVIGLVSESNEKSARFAHKLGFAAKHRIRDGWEPGIDLIVFEMRRDECPWLEVRQ